MILDFFYKFIELMVLLVKEMGYPGILLGMAIESSFIPFPSEVILIPAGAIAATGHMNLFFIFFFSLVGCLIGALFNYYIALFLGRPTVNFLVDKYGKFVLLDKRHLEKSDLFFNKYGEITTFTGRLIPVIRQLISLPAGFSKMNLFKFVFFTSLGAGIWSIILIAIGYFFGSNLNWISANKTYLTLSMILISLIILIIYILYKRSLFFRKKY